MEMQRLLDHFLTTMKTLAFISKCVSVIGARSQLINFESRLFKNMSLKCYWISYYWKNYQFDTDEKNPMVPNLILSSVPSFISIGWMLRCKSVKDIFIIGYIIIIIA